MDRNSDTQLEFGYFRWYFYTFELGSGIYSWDRVQLFEVTLKIKYVVQESKNQKIKNMNQNNSVNV